ncbi:MAG: hypothetical protein IKQ54_10900 [Oscillospiraceae bacterium]|nr:hypothetical protein [Oscillospiraceae bacterium]MBR4194822.1 hypothetical protein [Oscillospiraceae bacterium]
MRNPAKLLQLKKQYSAFLDRHPKFMRYLAYITDHYMEEGSVMDVTVTAPDGRSLHGNAKLTAEDVAFLQEVRQMLSGD